MTNDSISIEIRYIKEMLEEFIKDSKEEFKLNRNQHSEIIKKQNITNGSIIQHEDRISFLEKKQDINRGWIKFIPHVLIVLVTVINVAISYHNLN